MPIYTNDPDFSEDVVHLRTPLRSSVGIGPKVTKFIDDATSKWLDEHPEATTTVEDNSITTSKLMNRVVTNDKMALNSVGQDNVIDGSIGSSEIADGSVTTPKIRNGAVTSDKLSSNAIPLMSTSVKGIARVGAGLAMNGDALELNGDGDISTAVESWLDEHPEATTTVEDGSVTAHKLGDDLASCLDNSQAASASSKVIQRVESTVVGKDPLLISDEDGNILFGSYDLVRSAPEDISVSPGVLIADDFGNVAFEASHGLPNTLFGKTFSIIGDSISTYDGMIPSGYGTYYPRGDVDKIYYTWWSVLSEMTGMRLIGNASWSGSRMIGDSEDSTGRVGCSTKRVSDVAGTNGEHPDFIIIEMGTNDFGYESPIGDTSSPQTRPSTGTIGNFADAYKLLLYRLRETYPSSVIIACTILPRINIQGQPEIFVNDIDKTIIDYNDAIRDVAGAMCCTICDLYSCGIHPWLSDDMFVDRLTHPNKDAMKIIAKSVRQTIESANNM